MNLGIFLSSGDSFEGMAKVGQDIRFINFYLKAFSKSFDNVYVFSYKNESSKDIIGLPKNVYIIPNKHNLHRILYGFLLPIINFNIISVCHVFRSYHLLGTLPAIISKVILNKPFIFNYGYDYNEFARIEKKHLQNLLLYLIHPFAIFFADKIVAVTKAVLDWTPKDKVIYIPNGVDTKIFKPIKTQKNIKPLILCVGRLETQKNYLNFMEGLKGLKVDLLIIGRGSLQEELISLSKKLKVSLEIKERVQNTELPYYYNNCDIFMLPSLTEGPVKVILEAMACGCAVIGAYVPGIKEVIIDGKNGVFCGIDPKSIKEAIIRVLSDKKLYKEIKKNARLDILEKFDLNKLLRKEISLLKEVGSYA